MSNPVAKAPAKDTSALLSKDGLVVMDFVREVCLQFLYVSRAFQAGQVYAAAMAMPYRVNEGQRRLIYDCLNHLADIQILYEIPLPDVALHERVFVQHPSYYQAPTPGQRVAAGSSELYRALKGFLRAYDAAQHFIPVSDETRSLNSWATGARKLLTDLDAL
jgi:hypothetical protein